MIDQEEEDEGDTPATLVRLYENNKGKKMAEVR